MRPLFSVKETSCRCGCGLNVQPSLLKTIIRIRRDYGKKIYVVSGARCPTHNTRIGGATHSKHCRGVAIDFVRTPELLKFLIDNAEKYCVSIEDPERTPSWIHMDLHQRGGKWGVFKV